jgi:hypothetical protein
LHLDICMGTNAPAVNIAASQIGRCRHDDRIRLRILRRLYSLSSSTARFLSHATTIANSDCSHSSPQWHVICSLWTEFAKADQGGSRFNLRSTQQSGEVNPSPFGTLSG